MNKKQKELIEFALPYEFGKPLKSIYIIPTGRQYNGFWGKNGYNDIKVVGLGWEDNNYYIINPNTDCDVISFFDLGESARFIQIDVPKRLNCIRLWCDRPICFNDTLSVLTPCKYTGEIK